MEEEKKEIRTRFAPSPTGELHIGAARTSLFNYVLAKKNKGKFIFRIEDTDKKKIKEKYIKRQYEDLVWLGLKPDESFAQKGPFGPYRQSQRLEKYFKYLQRLLSEKKAYYCFCSSHELNEEKENYIKEKGRKNYQYSRKCLNLTKDQIDSLLSKKKNYLIRLYINRERNYEFYDLLRGKIIFKGSDIEDFVLCRSDGLPLMNFVVVIDDYLMKISHVLRGEEHITNTSKQLILYELFNWIPPKFCHIPLILNSGKKKISKSKEKENYFQIIRNLRKLGYLNDAILNYLLFLGWHPKNTNKEIFTLKEAIKCFDIKNLQLHGAIFSIEKLNWYNNYYIKIMKKEMFEEYAWNFLKKAYKLNSEEREWSIKIAYLFRPRLNFFQELVRLSVFFFRIPKKVEVNFELFDFISKNLDRIISLLEKIENWNEVNIKEIVKYTDKSFLPLMREIITNEKKGPSLIEIIYLLGKNETIFRLKQSKNN